MNVKNVIKSLMLQSNLLLGVDMLKKQSNFSYNLKCYQFDLKII